MKRIQALVYFEFRRLPTLLFCYKQSSSTIGSDSPLKCQLIKIAKSSLRKDYLLSIVIKEECRRAIKIKNKTKNKPKNEAKGKTKNKGKKTWKQQ